MNLELEHSMLDDPVRMKGFLIMDGEKHFFILSGNYLMYYPDKFPLSEKQLQGIFNLRLVKGAPIISASNPQQITMQFQKGPAVQLQASTEATCGSWLNALMQDPDVHSGAADRQHCYPLLREALKYGGHTSDVVNREILHQAEAVQEYRKLVSKAATGRHVPQLTLAGLLEVFCPPMGKMRRKAVKSVYRHCSRNCAVALEVLATMHGVDESCVSEEDELSMLGVAEIGLAANKLLSSRSQDDGQSIRTSPMASTEKPIGSCSDEGRYLFEDFVAAETVEGITTAFSKLTVAAGLPAAYSQYEPFATTSGKDENGTLHAHYQQLSQYCLPRSTFRQRNLWKLLDARLAEGGMTRAGAGKRKVDNGGSWSLLPAVVCARVIIVGAGPVGLRLAIELAMEGHRVVVIEKRHAFVRANILHLWAWVVHDLNGLGARFFYPQFCTSSDFLHVGTRQLQCILLKVALMVGVTVCYNTSYEGVEESKTTPAGWRVKTQQIKDESCVDLSASGLLYADAVVLACGQGAGHQASQKVGFSHTTTRTGTALGLVAHFDNGKTKAETSMKECSWALQFNQPMFAEMRRRGIDLENVVYYRGATHYFVMTPRVHSLLEQGVLHKDLKDGSLLSRDNIDPLALQQYARSVASFLGLPDSVPHSSERGAGVQIFDFSARLYANNAASVLPRGEPGSGESITSQSLLLLLSGDALMAPFWPEGLGINRGFLSALDTAWCVSRYASLACLQRQQPEQNELIASIMSQLLLAREGAYSIMRSVSVSLFVMVTCTHYRRLKGFSRKGLNEDITQYTLDPSTRYADATSSDKYEMGDIGRAVGLAMDQRPWSCVQHLAKLGERQKQKMKKK